MQQQVVEYSLHNKNIQVLSASAFRRLMTGCATMVHWSINYII